MKRLYVFFLFYFVCIIISDASEPDSIYCVNTTEAAYFRIALVKIKDVTIVATNECKQGTLFCEYIGEIGNKVVRISPLRDLDMDDSMFEDIKIGNTYVLVYSRIPPVTCLMPRDRMIIAETDETTRAWGLESIRAYNLNFGKVLPFQTVLKLNLPDNRPTQIKELESETFSRKIHDGKFHCFPKELMQRYIFHVVK